MTFSVTILGSSSALPTTKRFTTAQVLNVHERFFLIDCGEGAQIQLRKFSVPFSRLSHIFISHLHGDHLFGLFGLLSSLNLMGRKADMHIYAHEPFREILSWFLSRFAENMSFQVVFHPHPEGGGIIYSDKNLTVETFALRHSIPVAGFLFKETLRKLNIKKEEIKRLGLGIADIRKIKDGADFITPTGEVIPNTALTLPQAHARSYAFCTDTVVFPKMAECIRSVDLLYCEATFADKDKKLAKTTGHSTALQAARLAKNTAARKLIIGHFSTRYKSIMPLLEEARQVFSETYAVEDGDCYTIPAGIN